MINPTRTAWFFEEISGCLKMMEFQKFSRFQAAIFSTTSQCWHFQTPFESYLEDSLAEERCRNATTFQSSQAWHRHNTCISVTAFVFVDTKSQQKKPKALADTEKKNRFFSRWRAQNCPKMVDYVLFSASFHPFLVAGCFLGGYFLDVAPHLKLPNKQFNTGRGGKRTSMAARSSERVTWVK